MLLVPLKVSATTPATVQNTKVRGVVTNNGKPVKNAKVTVICKNVTKYAETDRHGDYEVTYRKDKCPVGSTVHVTATKRRLGGVSSTTVAGATARVNLAVVNVSVPEFGAVTGAAAVGTGVGALLYIRSRHNGVS